MWSVWLVFCDCGFQSVCPLMEKDKRLMEASWWETTEGETGSCSDGWGHAQYIFNSIFCWWVGLCSLLVIYLGPNYGGGNENNGDLLLHSVPPTLQQATANPHLCRRLLDTCRQVWISLLCVCVVGSLLLSPGSWCTQGSVYALQESVSPVLCKFWQPCAGLMATSSKRAYAIPRSAAPKAPASAAVHCWPVSPQVN